MERCEFSKNFRNSGSQWRLRVSLLFLNEMKDVQQSIEKGFSDLAKFAISSSLCSHIQSMFFFVVVLPFNSVSLDFVW